MRNRLPEKAYKFKICIICEGNEEYRYFQCLRELGVFDKQYEFLLVNAEGNGNLTARYQDRYQSGSFDLVLIFCDTEKKPYEQYEDIKRKINDFHGNENAAKEVILFGNPCTLQIVAKHWTDDIITSPAKKQNAELIRTFTGVKAYKARADQLDAVMKTITPENYAVMRKNLSRLTDDDTDAGSTNAELFFARFESSDSRWINEINGILEG